MWHAIQTFAEAGPELSDEDHLFERLEATATQQGYPYFAFGALWGDPEAYKAHPAPAVRLNYPAEWIAHYFALGYDKIDPVVSISPYAQTSITWEELKPYRPAFFDDAARYGLRAGISFPLRAITGCYVLCLASEENRTIDQAERAHLELFAQAFFLIYQRVRKLTRTDHGLSDNTIRVIRLAIAGYEVPEIAERLNLSKMGVYWCMKDARKRLDCANNAQLYSRAVQLGIVAL